MALRGSSRLCLVASFVMTYAFVMPISALGQTKTEVEMARNLMDEGDAKLESGDLKGALRSYRAAHTIMNVPTTGIEVARAEAKLGHLVEARRVAIDVVHMPTKPHEPKPFVEARSDAQLLADALETRIPRLTIRKKGVSDTASLEIKIDGHLVPSEDTRSAIALDPGKHEVSVATAGGVPEIETVTLAENEKRTLTIGDVSVAPDKPRASISPLTIVGFSLGGVGLVAGAVTGGLSLSTAGEVEKICPGGTCPNQAALDKANPKNDSAYLLANVSNVAFAVGVIGVGLGVTSLVLSKRDSKTPEKSPEAHLFVGPNGVGVRGTF